MKMAGKTDSLRDRALAADPEEISTLLFEPSEEVLAGLLENPHLDEAHLCLLLQV